MNPKPAAAVTFSIVGPKDRGTILSGTKISIKDGDTAFDVLLNATKQHGIQVKRVEAGQRLTLKESIIIMSLIMVPRVAGFLN